MASSPDESLGAADEAVRWPLVAKVGVVLAVLTVVGIVVAAVVAAFVVGPKDDDEATVLFDDALDPVVSVAFGSGFLYAERSSGQIVHVQRGGPSTLAADDSFLISPFAMVDDELATDGQRGLLGLAVRALDPDGPGDQTPEVVAGGFHNPFALAVVDDDVWVVDNAPGSQRERIVRIVADGSVEESELDGKRAPSGLAVDAAGDLLLCGFVSGLPCATGIAVLADGSVVTTTADAIWRN